VEDIVKRAQQANRNNITRANAYLQFYTECPEVHWALLAHVVSRNGGYDMTDLKGEWFSRVSTGGQPEKFFSLLERANYLIFGDAYPQLLLYQAGRNRQRNLSYLLPAFGVSTFMRPVWDHFWDTNDSEILTRALIVNEQNFIEERVIRNPKYQQSVLDSIQFKLQSLLNLTFILIPYASETGTRVAGCVVDDFAKVDDRIQTGITLYDTLFQHQANHDAMVEWLNSHPHTASRSDYWPECFSPHESLPKSEAYLPVFLDGRKSHRRVYSPKLQDVWTDVRHEPAEPGDWFRDLRHVRYVFEERKERPDDFTTKYIQSLQRVERLLVAKDAVTKTFRL
jgi:hypothetical protein